MSQVNRKEQAMNGQVGLAEPDPEVMVMPKRRQYSREYKRRILAEAAQCGRGELGGLLRREGLYYSTLSKWRQQQAAGRLAGQRSEASAESASQAQAIKRLERENARLMGQLAKAEAIIEVQKKLAALLELVNE